jgi:gliding motility-associated-like protein
VRTWTATDACGNSEIYTQTINVTDSSAPTLTSDLETNISVMCGEIPDVPQLEFEDACASQITVDFEESSTDDGSLNDYVITRTWTVSDECANEAIYTQTISVTVDAGITANSTELCIDDDFDFDLFSLLDGYSNTDGTWSITFGNATIDGGFFNPYELELGTYTFNYSDTTSACPSETEVTITLNDDCVVLPCADSFTKEDNISTAVTPNGDSYNEYFEIKDIEGCGFTVEIQIFNRWGALIYKSDNYQNTWNGFTHSNSIGNSDKVPTGTYYYIVNLKDSGLKPFAGPIYVGTK